MSTIIPSREHENSTAGKASRSTNRILFIAHRTPFPPNKGDKFRSFWQLETLARSYIIDLFAFYDDPEDERHFDRLGLYCHQHYVEKLSPIWSRLRALRALLSRQPFSIGFFYSKRMQHHVRAALATRTYSAVFVFSSSMAQYVEAFKNAPKILDLVDVDSDKWKQYARRSRWPLAQFWEREARRLAAYERRMVAEFSTTLVCTEAEAQLLRSFAPADNIRVLQNFLNVDSYPSIDFALPEEIQAWQPYVILSGSMDYFPNVDAALYFYREMFPLIRQKCPKLGFLIAGRKPHSSVTAIASDPSVRVTGSVSDMKPYIRGAAVAVVPMRIARGVQNKILEAFACGVPVVSTSTAASALPENLRSLLTVADSAADFANAVTKILQEGPQIGPTKLRSELRHHFDVLNLNRQLNDLISQHLPPECSPDGFPVRFRDHATGPNAIHNNLEASEIA